MNATISRRRLAQAAAGLVVSFSLPAGRALAQVNAAAIPTAGFGGKPISPTIVESYIAIDRRGRVTLYAGKVDLGTGVQTAFMQILAEELDVPFSAVTMIQGDTALTPDQGPTNGSMSVQAGGMQVRHAAATARRELLTLAASHLKAPVSALSVKDGVVRAAAGGSVTYGELLPAWKPLTLNVDNAAPLKSPADYTIVGKSVPRVDIPPKIFATFTYVQDFRLPGMLHGRVIRPPAVGATLLSVDHSSVPASVQIVRKGNFLAVAAPDEWAAIKAARSLKATWSDVQNLPDQDKLYDYVRSTQVARDQVSSAVGDVDSALAAAPRKLKATYEIAIQTHGSIGPSCSVAAMEDGVMTLWTPAQSSHNLRKQLAAMLNMKPENVRCIYIAGAGCYGRNGFEDVGADAALMAQALGKPVRVQWMRQDEHGWDPKSPPTVIDMEAGLDASGKVQAWNALFWYPDTTGNGNVTLLGADLAGLPSDGGMNPGGILNNTQIPYRFPNIKTTARRLASTPLRPGWLRTPGRMQNSFANESFLDEIAVASGVDPLDLRLQTMMDDPRGIATLQRVADISGWRHRPKADPHAAIATGYGLSYLKYEMDRTYVAAVAEVAVDRSSGAVQVKRFFIVQDCGQVINPDGTRNQIEGNVIQTLSRTMKERVTFDRRMVTSLDWSTYSIITFPEIPEIVIDLIDRPDSPPWGVGEATTAVVPPAVSNAIFAATGGRVRSMPFTPDVVKAAIPA
ncbi:MAG TPA: molybdopterin cofactor-binding domain-containing protein [Acidocella sp.]|uniref:xanthine dehydrogenase family protein molybdopterin-binding subunit n=1 Tax=Acidocella sp. TaxID=50710 RepID=UPI002B7E5C8E|nr:molybdopterin cofactor-binding domain-containing protein [Acidocella sp.]HVE21377.1 molybdopterin cofactor-binding domain-containing protein [Acidocella sp.]